MVGMKDANDPEVGRLVLIGRTLERLISSRVSIPKQPTKQPFTQALDALSAIPAPSTEKS
jgi:hypothetical protein